MIELKEMNIVKLVKKIRNLSIVSLSILFLVVSSVLSACGNSTGSSGSKGTIVVTTYGGTYDKVFKQYVVDPFVKKNPGVNVKLAPYTTVAKLANGGGKNIDIVSLDDFDIIDIGNKGLLDKMDAKQFSNWNDLYDQTYLKNKEGNTVGLAVEFGAWGIAYNHEKMNKPTSWNVFWDKEFKGKAAMMNQFIPDIIMTQKLTGATDSNMKPVWDAFKKVRPNISQYYSSFSAPEAMFDSGSIEVASWFDGRAIAMKKQGKPISFTVPKEGGVLIRGGEGILKSSKNKKMARKFIDFRLDPKVQANFAKHLYYGPTNKAAKLDNSLVNEGITYGQEAIDRLTVPDWNKILPERKDWFNQWTEVTSK
ncbi:ABC transporter substrate-binding protein [Sporolactobacillus sp. THM7-7]|nr:ABC transporter substrate-binding protein [Sporolactobacillus sp. THM7-7]